MKEVRFFYTPEINGELPEEEAIHATRVLRLQSGDEIMLMDGKGTFYKAEVTMTTKSRCLYTILEEQPQERQWNSKFHIAIAPTKMMERIEWMAEKATEIGIDELSFLNCKFSERKVIKKNRVEKIVVSDYPSAEALFDYLKGINSGLCEECVVQHKDISALYPLSVNTYRIVTVLTQGEPHIVYAFIRIGNGGRFVDNINAGGMAAPINIDTGVIEFPAFDKDSVYYE